MSWNGKRNRMSLYQTGLLAVLTAMILGFGIASVASGMRKGIVYGDSLLYVSEEDGVVRYTGRLDGEPAEFTVRSDGVVEYRWGEFRYGPYTVVEDSSAIPDGMSDSGPGFEIRREDEILFRGIGYGTKKENLVLVTENGEHLFPGGNMSISVGGDTKVYTLDGRELDLEESHEPSLNLLLWLVRGPELSHRGSFGAYLLVTLLAAVNILAICCPEWMFRLGLLGHVKNPEAAEPADFYLSYTRFFWAALTVLIAVLYWLAVRQIV